MDLLELNKVARDIELKRNQHPPVAVKIAVVFAFEVQKVSWRVVDSQEGRQIVRSKAQGKRGFFGLAEPVDAQQLREEFFGLRTETGLLKFLNKYGEWDYSVTADTVRSFFDQQMILKELQDSQPSVRRVALQMGWHRKFTCSLSWQAPVKPSGRPVAIWQVECRSIMDALVATIQIDLIRGITYRTCRRADCHCPFVPKTRRQLYHSQYCSHLVSLRRTRRISNARKWYGKGMSLTEIARRLRANRNSVKGWLGVSAAPRESK